MAPPKSKILINLSDFQLPSPEESSSLIIRNKLIILKLLPVIEKGER